MNYYLLAAFTASTALFLISWTAMINVFAVCCQIMGGFIAVACCYLAARQIASTKNREDTREAMIKYLVFGFFINFAAIILLLTLFGSKEWAKGIGNSSLFYGIFSFDAIYTMLWIVIPGLDQDSADQEDIIYGIMQLHIVKFILLWRLIVLAYEAFYRWLDQRFP